MDGTSPVLETAVRWLGMYFPGKGPPFPVPLHLCGTASQLAVWDRLRAIPYGQTATYGQAPRSWRRREAGSASLRRLWAVRRGITPSPSLVTCHRVVGANGSLDGLCGRHWEKGEAIDAGRRGYAGSFIPGKGALWGAENIKAEQRPFTVQAEGVEGKAPNSPKAGYLNYTLARVAPSQGMPCPG